MVITPQMYEKNTYVFYPLRLIYTYLISSDANVNDGISMKIYLSSIENYIFYYNYLHLLRIFYIFAVG